MNASEYSQNRVEAAIAVVGSLFIHTIVFLLLILWLSLASYTTIKSLADQKKGAPEKQYVLLTPEYLQEKARSIPVKKKFAEVNPSIPDHDIKEANLIGEKSSLGASETTLDVGEPNMPTQITREDLDQYLPNTFNADFIDGEIERNPAPDNNASEKQVIEIVKQSTEIADSPDDGENVEEKLAKPTEQNKEKTAETTTQIPVPEKAIEDLLKPAENEPLEIAELDTTEGKKKNERGLPKKAELAQKSQAGFQTQQRKTRIVGSLSRDGASSLEVQKTALGKYYATISKIIERKWQQNCLQYREHIQPGVISMQFLVDTDGTVSNPKPHDVVSTSPIQVGFTMKAIRSSQLPPMPKAVKSELDGERLELIYNFYF